MADLKVGIIGCGGHAQGHFRMVADEPRLHLAAIAELDDKRRAENQDQWQPEQNFADYRQMLDVCDLDIVYICTMPGHIVPIVHDCLERGLHTSVEKPPGMSAADTESMAAAAGQSSGKNMVSFNRRYFPQVLAVRRMIQERGGAVHCAATYNKPYAQIGTKAWAAITPDPIICDAIHHVDLLRWLAGTGPTVAAKPTAVYSEVQDGAREAAHRHNAIIHFDSGAIAVMMSHYGVGARIQRAEVHAEDFSAYFDLTSGPLCELYQAEDLGPDQNARGGLWEGNLDLEPTGGPDFNETRHFVDCILQDQTPWSTLDDAVHTMHLCEAIRRGHKGAL